MAINTLKMADALAAIRTQSSIKLTLGYYPIDVINLHGSVGVERSMSIATIAIQRRSSMAQEHLPQSTKEPLPVQNLAHYHTFPPIITYLARFGANLSCGAFA